MNFRRNLFHGAFRGLPREIWALFLVRIIVSLGSFVGPFLTMMLTIKMGWDERSAGFFLSGVALASGFGMILGGKLGDTVGRRATLLGLMTSTAVIFVICAAGNFAPFVPYATALGLSLLSGSWPIMNAVVADVVPPERRKEAFSLLYWGTNVGFALGPLTAGFLFSRAPALMFVGNSLAILFAAITVLLYIQETRPAEANALPCLRPGAEVNPGSGSPVSQPAEPAAVTGSTWTIFRDNPTLTLFTLLWILTSFVYGQHIFSLPLFLRDLLGTKTGPEAFGMAMTTNGLTVVACTALVTTLSRRFPALVDVAIGCAFYAVGFASYSAAYGLPFVLGSTFVWTIGEILSATNGNAFIADHTPPSHRGRVNSVVAFCSLGGSALAPLVGGTAARAMGTRAIWIPVGGFAALASLGAFLLHRFDVRRQNRILHQKIR